MPFAAYTSDWPGFLQGLLGLVVAAIGLVLANLAAKALLRLPPFRDMAVRTRKLVGVIGVFAALAVFIAGGLNDHSGLVFAGCFTAVVSFVFAVRADGA